jgi:hypothetical protein
MSAIRKRLQLPLLADCCQSCFREADVAANVRNRDECEAVVDPKPPARMLPTGHRNRVKRPFKLREQGASTFQEQDGAQDRTPDVPIRHRGAVL